MGNESQNIFLCSIGIKVLFKKYQLSAIMERKYVHKFIILSIWQGFHVKPVLIWLTRKSVNCIIAIGIQFSMMHGPVLYLANMICGDLFALQPVWCEKITTNHIDHASNRPYCKKRLPCIITQYKIWIQYFMEISTSHFKSIKWCWHKLGSDSKLFIDIWRAWESRVARRNVLSLLDILRAIGSVTFKVSRNQ